MAELIGGYEIGAKILQVAQNVGKKTVGFVVEHIRSGAWGDVAEDMNVPRKPQAHIEYWSTPESVIKGEE